MALEDEMKRQIPVIEKEIDVIDKELEKLHSRANELLAKRKKKDHDLYILRTNFYPEEQKPVQMSLAKILEK